MFKVALALAGLLAGLALAVSAATANLGGAKVTCQPWAGTGPHWSCADPIGDVKGGVGPDIARVEWAEWGIQFVHVTFAKGSPLAHSAVFTDKVSVFLTTDKARYVLTVVARKPRQEVLRRLPNGKPLTITVPAERAVVFPRGKAVTLSYYPRQLGAGGLTSWRIKVARVMLNGTPGSSDYAPDKGWYR